MARTFVELREGNTGIAYRTTFWVGRNENPGQVVILQDAVRKAFKEDVFVGVVRGV